MLNDVALIKSKAKELYTGSPQW